MRRANVALMMVLAAGVLGGCAQKVPEAELQLKNVLAVTEVTGRQYKFTERSNGHKVEVSGVIEDDLRYTAALSVDGKEVLSEVDRDDARALHVVDFSRPTLFLNPPAKSGGRRPDGSAAKINTGPAPLPLSDLMAGNWVLDKKGGAELVQAQGLQPQLGQDAILDALTVLKYVDSNVGTTARRFNREDIRYRAADDPFPQPNKDAGEIRYDVPPADLTARDQVARSQEERESALPGIPYFRRLSIYVRHGAIVTVRESTNIRWRLDDPTQDIAARARDARLSVPSGGSLDRQAEAILKALNQVRARRSQDLIRPREMTLELNYPGTPIRVELPAGAVTGDLGSALGRGQVLGEGPA